ncbi:hypothetical protein Hamer_G026428 [Homarus americanus]|uniref:TMEM205-like domain-containing protein n=1 Tax=Homarus americanus TaxID=6706 RepID=A0A8J5N7N2_HOMAM|nr:hypothetical protein Hamer_G026428 [Homarus americanus]
MWMTFVLGLASSLRPRHVFAQATGALPALLFCSNAALMLVAVVMYTQHHPTHLWDTHQMMQGCILVTCFLVNLGIRLYLTPVLIKLITVKAYMKYSSTATLAGPRQQTSRGPPVWFPRFKNCVIYSLPLDLRLGLGVILGSSNTGSHTQL